MEPFEFAKDYDDMNESELRATLIDVVSKHNEQATEYAESDYEATIESLTAERDDATEEAKFGRSFLSELAAEQKDMDADVLADRFSMEELAGMVTADVEEAPEEEAEESTFAEKPEKSDDLPGEQDDLAQYRTEARSALVNMGLIAPSDE